MLASEEKVHNMTFHALTKEGSRASQEKSLRQEFL